MRKVTSVLFIQIIFGFFSFVYSNNEPLDERVSEHELLERFLNSHQIFLAKKDD